MIFNLSKSKSSCKYMSDIGVGIVSVLGVTGSVCLWVNFPCVCGAYQVEEDIFLLSNLLCVRNNAEDNDNRNAC